MESETTPTVQDTPDVELQLLCHKLNVPVLNCQSGKPISNICTTHNCRAKSAYHCDQDDCFQCLKEHFDCTSMKLNKLLSLVHDQISMSSKLMAEIIDEENRMVEKIKTQRRDLFAKIELVGLPQKYKTVVKKIFGGRPNTEEDLTPSQVSDMLARLQQLRKKSQKPTQELIDNFSKDANQVSDIMLKLKRNIIGQLQNFAAQKEEIKGPTKDQKTALMTSASGFSKYFNKFWSFFKVNSNPNPNPVKIPIMKPRIICRDNPQTLQISKILPSYDQKTIEFMFDALKNPKQLKLLFRASEHEFSAKQFHKYCDKIRHTFVLIKTQYGKTIAGYTPCVWNYQIKGPQYDRSNSSFLLFLDHKQQMFISGNQSPISCYQNWGPIFGYFRDSKYDVRQPYSDIAICDQCHLKDNSQISYPYSYDLTPRNAKDSKPYYGSNNQTWNKMAGVHFGNYFLVPEYEVYSVNW